MLTIASQSVLFIVLFRVTVVMPFIVIPAAYSCISTLISTYVLFIFFHCHHCNPSLKYYLFS